MAGTFRFQLGADYVGGSGDIVSFDGTLFSSLAGTSNLLVGATSLPSLNQIFLSPGDLGGLTAADGTALRTTNAGYSFDYSGVSATAFMVGGDFGDSLRGGNSNDTLEGGAGADTLSGGPGFDTLSYAGSPAGVTVHLGTGGASGGHAAGDIISGMDNVTGSGSADVLIGDAGANLLSGGDGDDVLIGGAGNDMLNGGDGADVLYGGAGADAYDGGPGFDRLRYDNSAALVTVNLTNGTGTGGDAQGDTYANIEFVIGSAFNDTLNGSNGGDQLLGGDGNDSLLGQAGDDWLFGGAGGDVLYGGTGSDTLVGGTGGDAFITTYNDISPGTWDYVLDYTQGEPMILQGLDQNNLRFEDRGDHFVVSKAGLNFTGGLVILNAADLDFSQFQSAFVEVMFLF